jgi:hypothetical protein
LGVVLVDAGVTSCAGIVGGWVHAVVRGERLLRGELVSGALVIRLVCCAGLLVPPWWVLLPRVLLLVACVGVACWGVGTWLSGWWAGRAHCWVLRERTFGAGPAVWWALAFVCCFVRGRSPVIPRGSLVLGGLRSGGGVGWWLFVVCELHSGREHLCGQVF